MNTRPLDYNSRLIVDSVIIYKGEEMSERQKLIQGCVVKFIETNLKKSMDKKKQDERVRFQNVDRLVDYCDQ